MKHSGQLKAVMVCVLILCQIIAISAENIDPNNDDSQLAWGENIGWLNFEPNLPDPNVGASVNSEKLTGFIWSENFGWINLDPNDADPNTGVANNDDRKLSGLAWGENIGWINFDPNVPNDSNDYGVTIDDNGEFNGWAWGENVGWIHFKSASPVAYKVQTCVVNYIDLANFVDDWLDTGSGLVADLKDNNDVEFSDYSILANLWLSYCNDDWPLK